MTDDVLLTQDQINELIHLNEFIKSKKGATRAFIREMRSAILDSGKLQLEEWRTLRSSLREIEELIPVMDMIIKLKQDALAEGEVTE
jgi:hypothetical protein